MFDPVPVLEKIISLADMGDSRMIRRRTVLSAFAGLFGLLATGSNLRAADVSEI
jgi:hypothetical protein